MTRPQATLLIRGGPSRILLTALALQIIGVSAGVAIAAFEIESILFTGPLFSTTGGAIAGIWGTRYRGTRLFSFAISPCVLSLLVFLLINVQGWGPSEAQQPVTIVLIGYEVLAVPLGIWSLRTILGGAEVRPVAHWQFNLRSLLLATAVISVALAWARLAIEYGGGFLLATAIGLLAATSVTVGGVFVGGGKRFRRKTGLIETGTGTSENA